jgi:hypothetical protein
MHDKRSYIMLRETLLGVVAGALGTVAINMSTYVDMAVRGRASSDAPSKLVEIVAGKTGLPLSSQGVGAKDQKAQSRETGIGALLGYMNGFGVGAAYGAMRSQMDGTSIPLTGIAIGLISMTASDIPLVALKISKPKTWGISDWASDVIPHLIYGLITAAAYEALANRCQF